MSDELDDQSGDTSGDIPGDSSGDLSGDDARIRALLAELGSGPDGESMPTDVAARLDDTLARLVAERTEAGDASPEEVEERAGTVVPLRRRWAPRLTAAAAAVVVLAVGGVAASNLGVFNGSSADSKSSSAGGSTAGDSGTLAPSPSGTDDSAGRSALKAESLPRVRSTAFAADVTTLVEREDAVAPVPVSGSGGADSGSAKSRELAGEGAEARSPTPALGALSCAGPKITDGAVPSPIVYDGHVAVLVVHPETDGQQLVEAWNCQGSRRLDSATITP